MDLEDVDTPQGHPPCCEAAFYGGDDVIEVMLECCEPVKHLNKASLYDLVLKGDETRRKVFMNTLAKCASSVATILPGVINQDDIPQTRADAIQRLTSEQKKGLDLPDEFDEAEYSNFGFVVMKYGVLFIYCPGVCHNGGA